MLHIIVISMFVVIALRDSLREAMGGRGPAGVPGVWTWAASLGPMLALLGATLLIVGGLAREVRVRPRWRTIRLAERMLDVSRWGALVMLATSVLVLGWLDTVRSVTGDLIVIDELITIAPALLVIVAGWWAYQPIDECLRASATLGTAYRGEPMYPIPTRRQFVVMHVRHQLLLSLVPIGAILAWSELAERSVARLSRSARSDGAIGWIGEQLRDEVSRGWTLTVLQLLGVIVVFAISPLLLRRIWDTIRLGPGPMRDSMLEVCRESGVSVRDLLVWRTHGTMLNGAVIGLVAPLRYILLTDALLDRLSQSEVEAVMAHEVGHARHAHMPWLAASMLAGFMGAAVLVSIGAWGAIEAAGLLALRPAAEHLVGSWAGGGLAIMLSFALGIGWFGFVSRRFEWQADAFAVKQLSRTQPASADASAIVEPIGATPAEVDGVKRVHPDAVRVMVGALGAVAQMNHMPTTQFSWRHGSILHRQRRLRRIAGQPVGNLPIDRTARVLKVVVVLVLAAVVGLTVWQGMTTPAEPEATSQTSTPPWMTEGER